MIVKSFTISKWYNDEDVAPMKVIAYGVIEGDSGDDYPVVRYANLDYNCGCKGKIYNPQAECKHIRLFKEREQLEVTRMREEKSSGYWKWST